MNENSKHKYICDITKVFEISQIEILDGKNETYNKLKHDLENSNTIRYEDQKYSVNSIKGFIQSIIFCITHCNIDITDEVKNKYKSWFEIYKMESRDANELNQKNKIIITYQEYIDLVKKQFGVKSKHYLLVMMYNEVVGRDNFGNLMIITNDTEVIDTKQNYIIVPKKSVGNCIVILQEYKTSGGYGVKRVELSNTLSELILKYIKTNKLTIHLFPRNIENGLSDFVYLMNKKIGITGSINSIRHMKVSDKLNNPNITNEEKLELSNSMGHSVITQAKYRNNQS
jgi:hypothetical protein